MNENVLYVEVKSIKDNKGNLEALEIHDNIKYIAEKYYIEIDKFIVQNLSLQQLLDIRDEIDNELKRRQYEMSNLRS